MATQLREKQKRHTYMKHYAKSSYAKSRKCHRRVAKYRLYDNKITEQNELVTYKKNLIEDTVVTKKNTRCHHGTDHTYSKKRH